MKYIIMLFKYFKNDGIYFESENKFLVISQIHRENLQKKSHISYII